MRQTVPIVDLFSGPGGLAEGFAALRSPKGRRRFRIGLSIEKDPAAHRTLLLRAFLRSFGTRFPAEYYDFLNGVKDEPDWSKLYPNHWANACDETRCLELGTLDASEFLQHRIEQIRAEHGGRTVLLGGPPCQSYSVVGRARNAGKTGYRADEDDRQSLYEQYVQVLAQLGPALAVMENVKGMLSARRNGTPILPQVMHSLRHAGGVDRYQLFALDARSVARTWEEGLAPKDFLVHAENHGVPQSRHRVFVICVRRDLACTLPQGCLPQLQSRTDTVSVKDIIGSMPRLRSRLSQGDDPRSWQRVLRTACRLVYGNRPMMSREKEKQFWEAIARALATADGLAPPWSEACGKVSLPEGCPAKLRDWIFDDKLERLPNLTDHRSCSFPWPDGRDERKSGSSLPGADLAGFGSDDNGDCLAFGEVKTSSDPSYPPGAMYGRTGLKRQLEDLRDSQAVRDDLLKYLGHRAGLAQWRARFKRAASRYLQNTSDFQLYGFLVRDVEPHRDDLRARVSGLASGAGVGTRIELLALYLPQESLDGIGEAMISRRAESER